MNINRLEFVKDVCEKEVVVYTRYAVLAGRVKTGSRNKCWEWHGVLNSMGYGRPYVKGEGKVLAHRMMYEFYNQRRLKSEIIMHICDNPKCVNPLHLKKGTRSLNIKDCVNKGRHKSPFGKPGELNYSSKLKERI